jgi:ketosteroid isomerase-like protein
MEVLMLVEKIPAMERAALDRWGKGDPQGYLEIMADDITYFDPLQEIRIDGLDAMKSLLVPLTGQINVSHYEMLNSKVQHDGEIAVLTFNPLSYGEEPGASGNKRWNSTEVYRRIGQDWKIIHSHWSFTKPQVSE